MKNKTITKKEIKHMICMLNTIHTEQVNFVVDAVFATITKAIQNGHNISIPKFGIFKIHKMEARIGRNPKTGKPADIKGRDRIIFRTSSSLKKSLF